MLVPPDRAAGAAAVAGTVLLLGMTAGSALGGVLVATAGVTVAFAANAVSFVADVVVLHTIRVGPSPRVERAPRQVRDGLRYVWHSAALRVPLFAVGVLGTFALTLQVSLPILIEASFGGGPGAIGAAFTVATAGSLAGAVAAAIHGAPGPRTLRYAIVLMAAAMMATAVAPTVAVAMAGLAGVGIAWSVLLGSVIAIMQTADPRMMGRVMSLFGVVLLGGSAIGGPIAAAVTTMSGPRGPFALGALAAVTALAFVVPSARRRSSARLTAAETARVDDCAPAKIHVTGSLSLPRTFDSGNVPEPGGPGSARCSGSGNAGINGTG
jgi:predicted MFS family arabinose efflux permease